MLPDLIMSKSKITYFPIALDALLFQQHALYPRTVHVYARNSGRASEAMDVYLNGEITYPIRHDTASIVNIDGEEKRISEQHYVSFNSCDTNRTWNLSLAATSKKTRIKGDVLILRFHKHRRIFQTFDAPHILYFMELLGPLPLSFVFPSMKNCQ